MSGIEVVVSHEAWWLAEWGASAILSGCGDAACDVVLTTATTIMGGRAPLDRAWICWCPGPFAREPADWRENRGAWELGRLGAAITFAGPLVPVRFQDALRMAQALGVPAPGLLLDEVRMAMARELIDPLAWRPPPLWS